MVPDGGLSRTANISSSCTYDELMMTVRHNILPSIRFPDLLEPRVQCTAYKMDTLSIRTMISILVVETYRSRNGKLGCEQGLRLFWILKNNCFSKSNIKRIKKRYI